jgi:hypothetical protein
MNAGRELDALVVEKVMGCRLVGVLGEENSVWETPDGKVVGVQWSPSTDIAAAWKVVEKMRTDKTNPAYITIVAERTGVSVCIQTSGINVRGDADTAPHAICLAALKAVGANVPTAATAPRE